MIRLSRMADYAVLLMTQCAREDNTLHSAQQLALRTHLSMPTASKILKALAHADLLVSVRGAQGGYRLRHSAEHISVGDIIAAVDGPIALTDCADDAPGECALESLCPTRVGWQRINHAVKQALAEVSLAELVQPAAFPPAPAQPTTHNTGH